MSEIYHKQLFRQGNCLTVPSGEGFKSGTFFVIYKSIQNLEFIVFKIILYMFRLIPLCCLFLLMACQAENSSSETTAPSTPNNVVRQEVSVPAFEIESYQKEEHPRSVISVTMGNRKAKVTDTVGSSIISKSDYAQYKIPSDAIQACGGWWAGYGEYFYLIQKGEGNYFVLKTSVEEQQEGEPYQYKEVMNINTERGITPM